MMALKRILVVIALVLGVAVLSGHGEEPKKEKDQPRDLMRKKLESSQKILEGVAINDFDKIGDNAEELISISKQAEWKILKTPQYELYSNDFRRTAETLAKNAKEKNLDAAALTYVELTLTCVHCHKHVREVRRGRLDGPPDDLDALSRRLAAPTP